MDFTSTFFVDGIARFSYGWINPNRAAAVIGTVLPFLWSGSWFYHHCKKLDKIIIVFWALECILLVLLVATFSRGAIVAVLTGALWHAYLISRFNSPNFGHRILSALNEIWPRVLLIGCVLFASNVWRRFFEIIATGDASVSNRITVWSGALRMIFEKPLRGWGIGQSGYEYMNWFQDPLTDEGYKTMINSFLTIAVECGIGGLIVIIFILCTTIFLCLKPTNGSPVKFVHLSACAVSVYIFACCSFFSTLIRVPTVVWILILVCMVSLILAVSSLSAFEILKITSKSLIVSVVSGMFLFVLGWIYQGLDENITAKYNKNGIVLFQWNEVAGLRLCILTDSKVLGQPPGKPIRHALEEAEIKLSGLEVLPPGVGIPVDRPDVVYLLGTRIEEFARRPFLVDREIYFVCPNKEPSRNWDISPTAIFLPQIDDYGVNHSWKLWANERNCKVVVIPFSRPFLGYRFQELLNVLM